ncbi:MAG: patatin-like phospholipase family protein [Sphingomonas adhaesiva]|uniref:patatin-like phospholipase family protein n=1 Tax=Sphingomonas adhaesiva TaxID=28212 RepID=UPI002FF9C8C9
MTDRSSAPRIGLALQGGGAHGAYGWGVIDRLLEDGAEIAAVSGASAGALNGAALVTGLVEGGTDGARAALERVWRTVAARSPLSGFDWSALAGPWMEPWLRHGLEAAKLASRYFAPFTPGLADMRALRSVIAGTIDLDRLADPRAVPLHISATKVATGAARLFEGDGITLDALMASACLPDLFAPVEIDGEFHWDGGFSANPPVEPLVIDDRVTDIIVAQITPFAAGPPDRTPAAITRRINDITFNAVLARELGALTAMQSIARDTADADPRLAVLAALRLHMIEPPATLGGISKLDTRWSQIAWMRDLGRDHAGAWLAEHGAAIGCRSTLDALPGEMAA